MSLIPVFQIGVWNVWIIMLYHYFLPLLMIHHKGVKEKGQWVPHSKTDKKLYLAVATVWLLAFVYSIFLPLKLGSIWFYIGFPICILGVVTYTIVIVTFATSPIDNKPLDKGVYRYSRHPMYVTISVMFVGAGIASASWVFLLFSIVYTILTFVIAIPEEQFCLEKYGDAYREYVNRTPRWIGLPKSGKR